MTVAARKMELKQHFTEAQELNLLMCQLLGSVNGNSVLEPSVGHGAFLANLIGTPKEIDVVDIDPDAITATCSRFPTLNLLPHCDDFIDLFLENTLFSRHPLLTKKFDAVISNPPYGLFLEKEYRARLKRAFPDLYVRESYGLFLAFALSRLRPNGRYVFLVPDTFLASANHKPLRTFVAAQAAPTSIIRFPSKRFESVNFGYANLCIISGRRRPLTDNDRVTWVDVFDPRVALSVDGLDTAPIFTGKQLHDSLSTGWSLSSFTSPQPDNRNTQLLGDLAACRTGLYTGDNVRFIGYDPKRVTRRLNGHPIDWNDVVTTRSLTTHEKKNGISSGKHYVPLIRGGHRAPFESSSSAVDWSTEAVAHYKTDRKARFQNSLYYFSEGLAVPMVAARRISASMMSNAVFDQGVVGVFPNNRDHLFPLLLYLNSQTASLAIKSLVNGSANNSANYMKRLVVPRFRVDACEKARAIVTEAQRTGALTPEICDAFSNELK
jgi:hypothetical protein